ncbi:MAG TPA: sugar kinase [Patescibacteria group bacterium]|nr:sugar kinase [Patescibacteria group bacterium]
MVDIVTMGETMIQLNAFTSGPLRHVRYFEKHAAGTESNVAVGAVRMGYSAGWISRLGEDELGRFIHNFLKGEGVDVSRVRFDPDAPTGLYFVQRDYPLPGKSVVYYYRTGSAASRLRQEDLDLDYITSARIFHTTGITVALSPSCRATVDRALEAVGQSETQLSLDTNIRLKLWSPEEARRTLLDYIALTDVLFTDVNDSRILLRKADPAEAAEEFLSMGPGTVVVKMGAEGAYAATSEGEAGFKPAYKVPVVDMIGAGDAFDAAFLTSRMRGLDLGRSLEVSNAAGALCVTVRGDVEAMPTYEDALSFLAGKEDILR